MLRYGKIETQFSSIYHKRRYRPALASTILVILYFSPIGTFQNLLLITYNYEEENSIQTDLDLWLFRKIGNCSFLPHQFSYVPAHYKAYDKTSSTREDSDQPAHPRRLIRVFADRMCLLQPQDYPKTDKRESLALCVDVQADRSICW